MALLEVFLLVSCFLPAGVYPYSLENDVPVRPLVLRDDEMRVLRTLRFYDSLQKRDSECSVPSEKDVNNGKHCPPENGIAGCLNGNKGYTSLDAAWEACGKVTGCGFIMRYSNGNFYLRRVSDPDGAGAGLWGYTYKPCPPAQEKCEDKFDSERCSQLVLTNGVDGECGDSSALWKRCCAYCKAEEEKAEKDEAKLEKKLDIISDEVKELQDALEKRDDCVDMAPAENCASVLSNNNCDTNWKVCKKTCDKCGVTGCYDISDAYQCWLEKQRGCDNPSVWCKQTCGQCGSADVPKKEMKLQDPFEKRDDCTDTAPGNHCATVLSKGWCEDSFAICAKTCGKCGACYDAIGAWQCSKMKERGQDDLNGQCKKTFGTC